MSEDEKNKYPSAKTTGGYLKTLSYKEAAKDSWNNTTVEDRKKILSIKNFSDNIFKEIFGFSAIDNIETITLQSIFEKLTAEEKKFLEDKLC